MARGHARQHRAARIALHVSAGGVDPRADALSVRRPRGDPGSAPAGCHAAGCSGVRGRRVGRGLRRLPEVIGASMSMLPFFQWCEASAVGSAIRTSQWAFAVIESVHLLGLAAIGGAVLLVDLRLLGLGLRQQTVAQIGRDAQPWLVGSLAVMLATGAALFMSESIKCYYSTPF